ncbi:MAG: DUF1622 domain-containing protein, partial [Synechococcales cyanobacterium RM1_1_8]|nr:DUF1622 domain-containing protein [Synechococcales cyanobacterium RM1_1_8]
MLCNGLLICICQLLALLVIVIGVVQAFAIYIHNALIRRQVFEAFQQGRLRLGYSFSLGLSFLIGATILKTMTSSEWNDIARLGIVIALRTILNLLLERAIRVGRQSSESLSELPPTAQFSPGSPAAA